MTTAAELTGSDRDKQKLRIWLRMLKISRQMEAEIRERLRVEFATTLPRFDVMAALYREPGGMKMTALSAALMVSNGNVTGIVERLVTDGFVVRVPVSGDRRAMIVRLTETGRNEFAHMAQVHEGWIASMLNMLSDEDADILVELLDNMQIRGVRVR
ncbi:MarR family winged helix-turn-helix transcriptional regulator [Hoeflea prorocentri]|uniref:MarR family transcriptional regulator n=1 Tax=Hoeflea prorocentri TaxID=1922333 RepID=A0A9X3UI73_9HYPH|nr:MarR family transcriptional regulator [Hoeflea prorocentri]MCY6381323.1 MarR family transcriptional regulator [Hoeflea prorocentri]MDA5399123.1 MarR family transcriptional regulator [Hoeflea prorocentri]